MRHFTAGTKANIGIEPDIIYVSHDKVHLKDSDGDYRNIEDLLAVKAIIEIERGATETAREKHPLINPESTHYQMIDGIESIERLEQMFTIEEMKVWSKITAMKYRLRICNKDEVEKEAVKIRGYEAYYKFLNGGKL